MIYELVTEMISGMVLRIVLRSF